MRVVSIRLCVDSVLFLFFPTDKCAGGSFFFTIRLFFPLFLCYSSLSCGGLRKHSVTTRRIVFSKFAPSRFVGLTLELIGSPTHARTKNWFSNQPFLFDSIFRYETTHNPIKLHPTDTFNPKFKTSETFFYKPRARLFSHIHFFKCFFIAFTSL